MCLACYPERECRLPSPERRENVMARGMHYRHVGIVTSAYHPTEYRGPTMRNIMTGAHERRRFPRTNQMLAARVCVAIEETIADSDDIQVFADDGRITLRGAARADEMIDLLNAASSVNGVTLVSSDLETF